MITKVSLGSNLSRRINAYALPARIALWAEVERMSAEISAISVQTYSLSEGESCLPPEENLVIELDVYYNDQSQHMFCVTISDAHENKDVGHFPLYKNNYFDRIFGQYWWIATLQNDETSFTSPEKVRNVELARNASHAHGASLVQAAVYKTNYRISEFLANKLFAFVATVYPTRQNPFLRDILRFSSNRSVDLRP